MHPVTSIVRMDTLASHRAEFCHAALIVQRCAKAGLFGRMMMRVGA